MNGTCFSSLGKGLHFKSQPQRPSDGMKHNKPLWRWWEPSQNTTRDEMQLWPAPYEKILPFPPDAFQKLSSIPSGAGNSHIQKTISEGSVKSSRPVTAEKCFSQNSFIMCTYTHIYQPDQKKFFWMYLNFSNRCKEKHKNILSAN